MAIESSILSQLSAEAKAHRAAGDAAYARANDIERAIALLSGGKSATMSSTGRSSAKSSARAVGAAVVRKGKPVGAMSQRWRGNFAEIIRIVPNPHVFGFNHVRDVVKRREDRDMRDSEIRRLFEGNVKHGYLVKPARDLYQPTQKLVELIGLSSFNGGSLPQPVASQAPLFGYPTQEAAHGG